MIRWPFASRLLATPIAPPTALAPEMALPPANLSPGQAEARPTPPAPGTWLARAQAQRAQNGCLPPLPAKGFLEALQAAYASLDAAALSELRTRLMRTLTASQAVAVLDDALSHPETSMAQALAPMLQGWVLSNFLTVQDDPVFLALPNDSPVHVAVYRQTVAAWDHEATKVWRPGLWDGGFWTRDPSPLDMALVAHACHHTPAMWRVVHAAAAVFSWTYSHLDATPLAQAAFARLAGMRSLSAELSGWLAEHGYVADWNAVAADRVWELPAVVAPMVAAALQAGDEFLAQGFLEAFVRPEEHAETRRLAAIEGVRQASTPPDARCCVRPGTERALSRCGSGELLELEKEAAEEESPQPGTLNLIAFYKACVVHDHAAMRTGLADAALRASLLREDDFPWRDVLQQILDDPNTMAVFLAGLTAEERPLWVRAQAAWLRPAHAGLAVESAVLLLRWVASHDADTVEQVCAHILDRVLDGRSGWALQQLMEGVSDAHRAVIMEAMRQRLADPNRRPPRERQCGLPYVPR